ncbi:2-amino-4-hydroxy-6-hydroxymethyldihydropteridine diphosphokinase [Stieleria marina]|uniref:2-amino-4-hydroxy-6- hydroxymethyldihydropteridine diphosphokinase n=1 Tax=Stieleria marina TaxID=1930275 RepID=UPI003AF3579B
MTPPSPTNHSQCLISFGSNLGDRNDVLAEAARRISQSGLILGGCQLRTSRLFETPPIGGPGGQDPFLNAVGAFETDASARDVLALLQELELDLGRQRHRRWAARSIDLDVVLHGELVGGGTGLIVPHPRYTARQFVLKPACDVAAHYRDPRFGWTLARLTEHVSAGNASIALVGGDAKTRGELCDRLADEHGIQTYAATPMAPSMPVVGNAPAAVRPADSDLPLGEPIEHCGDQPWIAAYLPKLPIDADPASDAVNSPSVPRLVARLQRATEETRWPAPHQIWPGGWEWPEYRLEVDDLAWAVTELVSALDSMRCEVTPVTDDGRWWE